MSTRDKLAAVVWCASWLAAVIVGALTSLVHGLAAFAAVGFVTSLLLGWRRR